MITEVKVQNYKSLGSLDLPLGRINVLIGENGSGKSNILEALALGAAASNNKLDNEFLYSRGIRVTQNPIFMRSAFNAENIAKEIALSFKATDGIQLEFKLSNDNKPYSSWIEKSLGGSNVGEILGKLQNMIDAGTISEHDRMRADIVRNILMDNQVISYLREFLIYAPENSILRSSEREGQILPLGIRGEGILRYLRYLSARENADRLEDIKTRLRFLDWFGDFSMQDEFPETETRIDIQDKYIPADVGTIDQISTNEGFLLVLFYFCLLVGAETPRFFAVDNIDTSLNPRLCTRLMKEIVNLAKKYDKQVILTTHNPAILDGVNLDDDEQRLFIVRRNKIGQTTIKRFLKPAAQEGIEPVRLSEAFMRGYIGGLPRNF